MAQHYMVSLKTAYFLLLAQVGIVASPLSALQSWIYEHQKTATAITGVTLAGYAWYNYASNEKSPLRWDWYQLENSGDLQPCNLNFPKNFIWGAGSSAQQVEGDCFNNSWHRWQQEKKLQKAGIACNQWNLEQFRNDCKLMQSIGLTAYRFSIEWSKLEPAEGIFDQDGFDHYEALCQELVAQGIRPVITLHHYTDPLWFVDQGAFEKQENIRYYVRFCTEIFKQLNKYQPLWLTFNSPASYAINSYHRGTRPPGKNSMQTAMEVLANMLHAHASAYQAMKNIDQKSEIGILHNIFHIEVGNRYNPFDHLARYLANKLSHTCIYDFFTTGIFSIHIPGMVRVTTHNEKAHASLDFIGLNYYSHGYMHWFKPQAAHDEIQTDNPQYTIYAEGLYSAIEELDACIVQPLKKINGKEMPIYVTENGIATTDDAKRDLFFKRTMYALAQACKKFNVVGYVHWAFMDNYEWGSYEKKYGIFSVDFKTQQRLLKPGSSHFVQTIAAHKNHSTQPQ